MLNTLISSFVLLVFVVAVLFVFLGKRIIMILPAVRRLNRAKNDLSQIELARPISRNTRLLELCHRLIAEFLPANDALRNHYGHRSMGDAVEIVHYKMRNLKQITKELQTYAFLLTILGVVGLLKYLYKAHFVLSFNAFLTAVGEDPVQLIALFELVMLMIFTIRLIIELSAIKELLEE